MKRKLALIFGWMMAPLSVLFALSKIGPVAGQFGHDYGHYFARLIIGRDFFLKNGFQVPHFTPYLCGGMPFYADPQAISHSLQQWLVLFLSPWLATQVTFGVFYLLGYGGFWILGRDILKLSPVARHFASVLFVLNGFTFLHLSVGHVTHYPFLLIPWVLYGLFRKTGGSFREVLVSASILILVSAYTFYSGGLHILIVFSALAWVLFPLLIHRKREEKELKDIATVVVLATGGFLAVSAGKLAAVFSLAPIIHEHGIDRSSLSPLDLLLRYLWFNPFETPGFILFGKWAFGVWEFVAFVSKFTLVGLAVGAVFLVRESGRRGRLTLFACGLTSLGLILFASGRGGNESLPFFRHYHNPLKTLAAFIPILVAMTAYAFDRLASMKGIREMSVIGKTACVGIIGVILWIEYTVYTAILATHPGFQGTPMQLAGVQTPLPVVTAVSNREHADLWEASQGRTSLACYEPLFGYHAEELSHSTIKTDRPADLIEAGAFNLHHPGCFLYGKSLGCRSWERISTSEGPAFEEFRRGLAVPVWVPGWQQALDRLSFFAFILCLLPFAMRRRVRMKALEEATA